MMQKNSVLEVAIMTLREYETTPISFMNHWYRDGWEVVDIDKRFKAVVLARAV